MWRLRCFRAARFLLNPQSDPTSRIGHCGATLSSSKTSPANAAGAIAWQSNNSIRARRKGRRHEKSAVAASEGSRERAAFIFLAPVIWDHCRRRAKLWSTVFDARCPSLETVGVDRELAGLFKYAMRSLQSEAASVTVVEHPNTELGAAQHWILHYAIMLFGTCDAARVLATHNLPREAWLNQRHAFEIMVRAGYFGSNPGAALNELRAEPLRKLKHLELQGATDDERYKVMSERAAEALASYPELATFSLPPLEQMIDADPGVRANVYGRHYRFPSSLAHGDVRSFDLTMQSGPDGGLRASFDSRAPGWRISELIASLTIYLLCFRPFIAGAFEREDPAGNDEAMAALVAIDRRLFVARSQP